jgi:hypothetical protein
MIADSKENFCLVVTCREVRWNSDLGPAMMMKKSQASPLVLWQCLRPHHSSPNSVVYIWCVCMCAVRIDAWTCVCACCIVQSFVFKYLRSHVVTWCESSSFGRFATMAEKMTEREKEKNAKALQELLKLPENRHCADCGAKHPRWASANLRVFVCIRCSGTLCGLVYIRHCVYACM